MCRRVFCLCVCLLTLFFDTKGGKGAAALRAEQFKARVAPLIHICEQVHKAFLPPVSIGYGNPEFYGPKWLAAVVGSAKTIGFIALVKSAVEVAADMSKTNVNAVAYKGCSTLAFASEKLFECLKHKQECVKQKFENAFKNVRGALKALAPKRSGPFRDYEDTIAIKEAMQQVLGFLAEMYKISGDRLFSASSKQQSTGRKPVQWEIVKNPVHFTVVH
ncbi:MAG: hypothetical protein M1549_01640 [Candidatus Dependentiae bacterium]|nr:hypothetical protein [Candidatus Dependentiae bacterium]